MAFNGSILFNINIKYFDRRPSYLDICFVLTVASRVPDNLSLFSFADVTHDEQQNHPQHARENQDSNENHRDCKPFVTIVFVC